MDLRPHFKHNLKVKMLKHITLLLVIISSIGQANAFRRAAPARGFAAKLRMSSDSKGLKGFFQKALKSTIMPALMGAALISTPLGGDIPDAHAARSGGRSGGSSFRSAPSSSRSSTALRSSYSNSGYGGRSSVTIMPMYSPFGYGGGFGFSPFGFMPINLNVIILAGVAYAVYTALSNRAGGSDFSIDGTSGSLGGGATVLKLQLSLSSDWKQPENIMETLTRLAEKNSAMTGRNDLAKLLPESSLALLRRQNDWNAAAYEGEMFAFGPQKAEPYFQRLAIQERAKFEEENSSSSVAVIKSTNTGSSKPTQVVVSLVVAVRGSSSAFLQSVRSVVDSKKSPSRTRC